MKLSDLTDTGQVSVSMDDLSEEDRKQIAGMLRGLACSIVGYESVADMTDDRFLADDPVDWEFGNGEKARAFKECVDKYFADEICRRLKITLKGTRA